MQFAPQNRTTRRPSLTPMIDVVFLLLVFFMLASQFGADKVMRLPVAGTGGDKEYTGPPRLVTIEQSGMFLNGVVTSPENLVMTLRSLVEKPSDPIVLRGRNQATTQNILDILGLLQKAGFSTVILIE